MDFSRILGNWQTSIAGVVVILMSGFDTFIYDLPQWNVGFTESFAVGVALILAKDASTGSAP
jgi:hypothetical protein